MEQSLQTKNALGYGVASIAESSMYQLVNGYLLLYLTSVVGVGADKAGLVMSVGMVFETMAGLIIGKLSDSCTSPKGRRRPFMIFCAIYVPIVLILLFSNYSGIFGGGSLIFPYLFLNILFWIGHSAMYIPYTAFGAELATGYDDRTRLRSMCSIFSVVGSFLGSACPLMAVSFFSSQLRAGDSTAWFLTAAAIAICNGVAIFIGWKLTAGMEHMPLDGRFRPMEALAEIPLLLKDYWQLMKLKTMKILIVFKVAFNVAYGFFTASMVFFLQYRLGFGNEVTSTIYSIQIVVNFINVLIVSRIALRVGKSATLLFSMSIAGFGCMAFYIAGIESYAALIVFIILFSLASNSFWQLSNAIFYDVTEVDEFVYGKRREGAIISLQSGIGSLASAAIVAGMGMYLEIIGFDTALPVQTPAAMAALDRLFLMLPGLFLMAGCAMLLLYPLSKARFASLQSALRLKNKGSDYSMYQNDLDKIL